MERLRAGWLVMVIWLGVLVQAAPAVAQDREQLQMMADIRMLQEQSLQLQRLLTSLNDLLAATNAALDEQALEQRKTAADQKLLVETVGSEVRVVRERLDDTNVRLSSLSQEVEALRQSMPVVPAMPGYTALPPGPGEPAGSGDVATTGAPGAVPMPPINPAAGLSPQRLFDEARADYAVGQWALAIQGFETLIRSFPRSELAPRAQYYIGESYRLDGRDTDAMGAYRAVILNYPQSTSVAEAYYRQGLLFEQQGRREEAVAAWQHVVENHPESEAALLCRQKLELIGGQ